MCAAVIPPPKEYEEWFDKSREFQDRFNVLFKEIDSVQFTSKNLDAEFPKLQEALGKIRILEKDFLDWWTKVENFSFHFWDNIPQSIVNQTETLHYDNFLMNRTVNLKGQLIQIMSGYNLRYSDYQWWKAYNKSIKALELSEKGLRVALWSLLLAILAIIVSLIPLMKSALSVLIRLFSR